MNFSHKFFPQFFFHLYLKIRQQHIIKKAKKRLKKKLSIEKDVTKREKVKVCYKHQKNAKISFLEKV